MAVPSIGLKDNYAMIQNFFSLIVIWRIDCVFAFIGGKAKPLKQPKVDKKEYDEVYLIYYVMDPCRRSIFYWILFFNTTFKMKSSYLRCLLVCSWVEIRTLDCLFLNPINGIYIIERSLSQTKAVMHI